MHRYLVALGSNMRHRRHGSPRAVIGAALVALRDAGLDLIAVSPPIETPPLGPSRRRYANAVAVLDCDRGPADLLDLLQAIEHRFGRRRRGSAWGARVLDLDIVLWKGGAWADHGAPTSLVIPHPAFRQRRFVLEPASRVAGEWRDPLTGLTLRQLTARLTKPRPTPS